MVRGHVTVVVTRLLSVMHEVTAWPVRTEADAVERTAQFGLVFRVALQIAQLLHAVRELTLVTVLALSRLLVRSAELGFVSRGIYLLWQRFGLRSFQLPVTGGGGSVASSVLVVAAVVVAAVVVAAVVVVAVDGVGAGARAAETELRQQLHTVQREHLQDILHHVTGRRLGSGTVQRMMCTTAAAAATTSTVAMLLLLVLSQWIVQVEQQI